MSSSCDRIPSPRSPAYRRAGRWLEVVRLYRANGYSSREITNLLNDGLLVLKKLHAEHRQVQPVEGGGFPDCKIVPPLECGHPLLVEFAPPESVAPVVTILSGEPLHELRSWWEQGYWWTVEQVVYHIRQQAEIGQMPALSFHCRKWRTLNEIMRDIREARIGAMGWDHLLPVERPGGRKKNVELKRLRSRASLTEQWKGKRLDLTMSEARVLTLLLDRGQMTGLEIGEALGHARGFVWSKLLGRLLDARMIVVAGTRRLKRTGVPARVYALAPELNTHSRTTHTDKMDLLEKRLDAGNDDVELAEIDEDES